MSKTQNNNTTKKDEFVLKWKILEEMCQSIFHTSASDSMDELFTRYMYYERAKSGNKSSTTEALRKFYLRDNYAILKSESTFNNLILLAKFWSDILNQNQEIIMLLIEEGPGEKMKKIIKVGLQVEIIINIMIEEEKIRGPVEIEILLEVKVEVGVGVEVKV